ncbi:MAG: metallophosphoesterase family protein [Clostridia bacterium]|nr:metallophosphoesterase family protein [Clostridia bacterium]
MGILSLLFSPFLVGVGFYLYFFIKRILKVLNIDADNKKAKIIIIIASVVLSALALNITSFYTILLLHIIGFALLCQLANFIVKKIAKEKYEGGFTCWKRIYGIGIIPVLLSVIILIFGYINLHSVQMTHYNINTSKDIRSEGYRVALIADVHFGVSLNYEEMIEKCAEISEQDADIIILCGDIVDNSTSKEQMKEAFKVLGSIKSKYGIYYVHGNHDRPMSLVKSAFTENELILEIEQNGITILQDESILINNELYLIGREDRSVQNHQGNRLSIEDLTKSLDKNKYLLTLDHQPNQYEENSSAGTDLLLSGHTHGGQLFPINILQMIIPFNDGIYGEYSLGENSSAIVTSGFAGWAYPVKTASPAEYVIIDIQKGK